MVRSISRKFLVQDLPDLSGKEKTTYERYYLYASDKTVIRIQKVNENYEIERKVNENNLVREEQTTKITKEEFEEFEELKKLTHQYILRDSYDISENPKTVLRIYHGDYEGLNRIEVNFNSNAEASSFIPLDWFGIEITDSPLGQDGRLLRLSKEEFQSEIENRVK